jgi:oligosaccharide repeat unit polymerase
MVKNLFYFLLLLGLLGFYILVPSTMNKSFMLLMLFIVIITLLSFTFRKERNQNLRGQFLRHSTLVLIGYCIVHFQYYIDYLVGNISKNNLDIWVNTHVVLKAFTLSVIGLICFVLGYSIYKKRRPAESVKSSSSEFQHVKFLTFLATITLIAYFFSANPLYLSGFYGQEDMGLWATYSVLTFTIIVFAILIQNSRNMIVANTIPRNLKEYVKYQGFFFSLLIGIYLLSVVISGDRGPIITVGLAYFSGYYFTTRKKLNWKAGLLLIFVGAAFISLLGVARSFNKNLDFSTKISEGLKKGSLHLTSSFLPQTQELAGSVKALHTTVNYVPQKQDFLFGRFQVEQLTVILPFFNIFNSLIYSENGVRFKGSASYITWIRQGDYPKFGEGTTCVADFYFDFGIWGVIIGMFIFGYTMRLAEVHMTGPRLPNLFMHSFLIVYLSYALYIGRSSFLFNFRTVFWVFIVLLINKYIFNKKFS